MLYISLVLIFLGILIFLYSILLDAKKRREMPSRTIAEPSATSAPAGPEAKAPEKPAAPVRKRAVSTGGATQEERGGRSPLAGMTGGIREDEPRPRRTERPVPAAPPALQADLNAVLYEDSSRVIDYANESGSIDPSLEKYRKIRRLGSGRVAVEKDGISFYMGKKMYRYDFNRVRDLKSGERHMALFIGGSESVKLFIFESGGAPVTAISDAYRDFVRRTS
jgi:hypothetical protein